MFKQISNDLFINHDHIMALDIHEGQLMIVMADGTVIPHPVVEGETLQETALKLASEINQAKTKLAQIGVR